MNSIGHGALGIGHRASGDGGKWRRRSERERDGYCAESVVVASVVVYRSSEREVSACCGHRGKFISDTVSVVVLVSSGPLGAHRRWH